MKRVTLWCYALFIFGLINSTYADTEKTIVFANQREEIFDLENFLKETRYKTETVDSTCYKKEPYVENVCREVTRYRQQCHTVPAHQDCRTVYDQVCHTENRYENECRYERGEPICRVVVNYRQECSTSDGGRQCHSVPGDVVCHRAPNGEQKCEKIPPREVCENTPGRQVCRQVPYEERECTEGPRREVCNQVNRPHQVCENHSRQQCDWIAESQECNQVPYEVTECKDETLYRQIPYACKETVKVPYEVTLKTHRANIQVLFNSKELDSNPEYKISLDSRGNLSLVGVNQNEEKIISLLKKEVKVEAQSDLNNIHAIFSIAQLKLTDLFDVRELNSIDLNKKSLSFVAVGKFEDKRSSLSVKISKKGSVKFEKILKSNQFKAVFDGKVTKINIDLESLGAPKLGGLFNKTHEVSLKLKLEVGDLGEVIIPFAKEISVSKTVEAEAK